MTLRRMGTYLEYGRVPAQLQAPLVHALLGTLHIRFACPATASSRVFHLFNVQEAGGRVHELPLPSPLQPGSQALHTSAPVACGPEYRHVYHNFSKACRFRSHLLAVCSVMLCTSVTDVPSFWSAYARILGCCEHALPGNLLNICACCASEPCIAAL